MKTLNDFKNELRLIMSDKWGNALDTWFECAGHMYNRGLEIPLLWEYKIGHGSGMEEDNYFYELFIEASDELLVEIGNFLFRYCQMLKHYGLDY